MIGVLTVTEKLTGTAYFLRNARRVDDLEDFRKESVRKRIKPKQYITEKVIALSKIDYENFTTDLLADRQLIADNTHLMFVDVNNIWHCLLVLEKGKEDIGILVDGKKKDFPMYSAVYKKQPGLRLI